MPKSTLITGKLASFKKYGKIEIPEENVILFANSKESLESFVARFVTGDMKITNDIDKALKQVASELPVVMKNADKEDKGTRLQELETWKMLLEDAAKDRARDFELLQQQIAQNALLMTKMGQPQ
jgi:hypothetical protein